MKLDIPDDQLEGFLACLGLGLLHAIRDGAAPADSGVATLGRTRSWKALEGRPELAEIAAIFAECDEPGSLHDLARADYERTLAALIERLERALHTGGAPSWTLTWEP